MSAGLFRRVGAASAALSALWLGAQGLMGAAPLGLACLVLLIAWPIWIARTEAAQMERRLIVEGLVERRSRIYRLLWPGHLVAAVEAAMAICAALLLLGVARLLEPAHWGVLAAAALALSLLAGPLACALRGIARPGMAGPLLRRWPLFLVGLLLVGAGFFVVDYAVIGAPDTRAMAWDAVAREAFAVGLGAETTVAAWLVGLLSAADALTWHASQTVIPALPEGSLKAVSWALVLGGAGIVALIFTRFVIGALAIAEGAAAGPGARGLPGAAVAIVLLFSVAFMPGLSRGPETTSEALIHHADRISRAVNPCGPAPLTPEGLTRLALVEIDGAEAAAAELGERRIAALAARLEADTAAGIERYLDWHYSVQGEYQRLAALAFGDLSGTLAARLGAAIPTGQRLADRIAAERRMLDALTDVRLAAAAQEATETARDRVAGADCLGAELVAIDLRGLAELTAPPVPEGALAGAAATLGLRTALSRVVAAQGARLGRQAALRTAGRLAARTAAKRGSGVLASAGGAAAVCAPGGPLAIACGLGAGLVAWISVDLLAVEIAEATGRDAMREKLKAKFGVRNRALVAHLEAHSAERRAALAQAHRARLAKAFIPARDG
ncbi:MAG: hypothetical protein ACFBRM_10505 [Pikeienuella sp.]